MLTLRNQYYRYDVSNALKAGGATGTFFFSKHPVYRLVS